MNKQLGKIGIGIIAAVAALIIVIIVFGILGLNAIGKASKKAEEVGAAVQKSTVDLVAAKDQVIIDMGDSNSSLRKNLNDTAKEVTSTMVSRAARDARYLVTSLADESNVLFVEATNEKGETKVGRCTDRNGNPIFDENGKPIAIASDSSTIGPADLSKAQPSDTVKALNVLSGRYLGGRPAAVATAPAKTKGTTTPAATPATEKRKLPF